MIGPADIKEVENFAARILDGALKYVHISRLHGGLESTWVALVRASGAREKGEVVFVVKRLADEQLREADVYQRLVGNLGALGPRLLGIVRGRPDRSALLFVEAISPCVEWPWSDSAASGRVLSHLAALHVNPGPDAYRVVADWDYEAAVRTRAEQTSAALDEAPRSYLPYDLLRVRPTVRRMAERLNTYRGELLRSKELGCTVLHGDVHSGNVLMTRTAAGERIVLLDWARARVGSPLEDVSSWLQSLRCWEPEAARRHDSLLVQYLAARQTRTLLDDNLRGAYWLAAASNAFSGALLYHLGLGLEALRSATPGAAAAALAQASAAARVVRRAAAFWC